MHLNKYTRMTQDNKQNEHKEENKKPQDQSGVMMEGHIKIFDPETGEVMEREVTKLTAVTVCQQIVNHPALIDCDGDSGKLDTLLSLIHI